MYTITKISLIRTAKIGLGIALVGLLLWAASIWGKTVQSIGVPIWTIAIFLLAFLALLYAPLRRVLRGRLVMDQPLLQPQSLLKAGALQDAIFNSANFSSIATDAQGVVQIFNVGAERMLGYKAADMVDKITPAGISDADEVIARAEALSVEFGTTITPGFEALVFKASRGIEDIYELTYIRQDGSRFPAVVSVTALRDDQDAIIGYLLIGTDNTARKLAEEALLKAGALQSAIFNSAISPASPLMRMVSSRSSTLAPSACWATPPPK